MAEMFLVTHSYIKPHLSKPVARHLKSPNHLFNKQHMTVCSLSLHRGSTESHKILKQKFIF